MMGMLPPFHAHGGLDVERAAVDGAHRPIRVEQMLLRRSKMARPRRAHIGPPAAAVEALVFGEDARERRKVKASEKFGATTNGKIDERSDEVGDLSLIHI